jgi:hypothetical protein
MIVRPIELRITSILTSRILSTFMKVDAYFLNTRFNPVIITQIWVLTIEYPLYRSYIQYMF